MDQSRTNGEQSCNRCCRHRYYCRWLPEGAHQKSCDHCAGQKSSCAIDGKRVSNQKRRDQSRAEWSRPRKKSRTEVEESELESDGSGEDGWRVRGLQSIAFGLLGLKESDNERNELLREQNELWREQNGYLRRIAEQLESGLGPEEVLDSTMRE